MTKLFITLGGGFDGHHVALALDGRPILDEEGVTSSPLIDLAKELPPLPVPGTGRELTATVTGPDGQEVETAKCSVSTGEENHVVIYLERAAGEAGRIRFASSDSPLGFG